MSHSLHLKTITLLSFLMVTSLLPGCTTTPQQPGQQLTTQTPVTSKPKTIPRLNTPTPTKFKLHDKAVQVGRYRVINAVPPEAQQQLLQVIIQVTLPEDIQTIQTAVEYLLQRSGYQLATSTTDRDVQQLLAKPLPAVHRQLGPMTLQNALEVLVGLPFQLNIDSVHRTLNYELAPRSSVRSGHE